MSLSWGKHCWDPIGSITSHLFAERTNLQVAEKLVMRVKLLHGEINVDHINIEYCDFVWIDLISLLELLYSIVFYWLSIIT